MFADIYLGENPQPPELLEGVSVYQREAQHPNSLCEAQLQRAKAVILWAESEEELRWAKLYQVPVFFLSYVAETEGDCYSKQFSRGEKGGYPCYTYQNGLSFQSAMEEILLQVLEYQEQKERNYLDTQKREFSFVFGDLEEISYSGQCFLEEKPWGSGVFSLKSQGALLLCCGNWFPQENGDYFAEKGRIYQKTIEKEALHYKGDFMLTKEEGFFFMDSCAEVYEQGKLLHRGGIYGKKRTDYCLQGETTTEKEVFSGYYGTEGKRVYGTLSQGEQLLYQGSFQHTEKEGFGHVQLSEGQRYQGIFQKGEFLGQGVMEYEHEGKTIKFSGVLPRESDYFLELSHITAENGKKLCSTAVPLAFPFHGKVKISYESGMTYEGEMSGCEKTSGIFRQGEETWQVSGSYGTFQEDFLRALLSHLDQEEEWYLLAFAHCPQAQILDYHLSLCQYLQKLHEAFAQKGVSFSELPQYPYESTEPTRHLEAYLKLKPSERIHLCVYALEAVEELLRNHKTELPLVVRG